jgi:hypothetical protein
LIIPYNNKRKNAITGILRNYQLFLWALPVIIWQFPVNIWVFPVNIWDFPREIMVGFW